jgi:hypothetical protein
MRKNTNENRSARAFAFFALGCKGGIDETPRFSLCVLSCPLLLAQAEWKDSTVIKISSTNEWCRHCPDWNQTSYSFKLDDGAVYIAQTHKKLDISVKVIRSSDSKKTAM